MAKAIPQKRGSPRAAAAITSDQSNREAWLTAAVTIMRGWFPLEHPLPQVRVSVGWGGSSRKSLGVCWSAKASKDNLCQIFVSPQIDEADEVLPVLLHQLGHAAFGGGNRHDLTFHGLATRLGFVRPFSLPNPEARLSRRFREEVVRILGAYPHTRLIPEQSGIPKEGTRLIKCWCPKSGYTVRTTAKWLTDFGPPISPITNQAMHTEYAPPKGKVAA